MNTNAPDPYDILHIDPNATPPEVTRAYRTLTRNRHPDTRPAREHRHGPGPGPGPGPTVPELQEELQELLDIMAAYAIPGNPEKRAAYDREHPRPVANPKAQPREGARVQTPEQPLRAAFVLIGPVSWEPPGGQTPGTRPRQGSHPPNGYTRIRWIPR